MRSLLLFLLALAILAAPHAARAARLEGVPAHVPAASSVDVRWSDLPAGTYEVELEVSLDGGPWLRASSERMALDGHAAWRAPAGVGHRAVLRLCAGSEHGEREVARSQAFVIDPAGRMPRPVEALQDARVAFHGRAPLGGRLGTATYQAHAECDADIEEDVRVPAAPAPACGTSLGLIVATGARDEAPLPSLHVTPAFRPLRN